MKTTLLIALVMLGMASCTKDNPDYITIPVSEDARWFLTINGNAADSFNIVFYTSVAPFLRTEYASVIGYGNNPLILKMVVGKPYSVQYMDTDSIVKIISHTAATKDDEFEDSIPATVF
jgi:hypothetical protein